MHFCFYAAPFGVVPIELDEVYPLSQHESALPLDKETIEYVAGQVADYVCRNEYEEVVFVDDAEVWDKTVLKACRKSCRQKRIRFVPLKAMLDQRS
jgi:predicted RNA-binding protein